jgi:hypothetical protein
LIQNRKLNTEIESKFANLDGIQDENNKNIEIAGNDVNKLIVSRKDSSISITKQILGSSDFFGYQNVKSKKNGTISCFTADVENNGFSYHQTY